MRNSRALLLSFAGLAALVAAPRAQDAPDFSRDVAPILSNRCYACHGPDARARRGELRLDERAGLFGAREGGAPVVPGDARGSALVRRLRAHGSERMPPQETGPALDEREIRVIEAWIDAGAVWRPHWAFVAPRREAHAEASPAEAIDRFVRARLAREGLAPSPEAARHELLRRVSFDLRGYAPSLEELEAFLADRAPGAYERVVDAFLASPAYGERMAFDWLSAARYSDTDGYQMDAVRQNWPWRDWVIDAFRRNVSYERFSTLQIAGDLVPGARAEERLATCFQRNHMANGEGGRDPEESRVDYVSDRVNTFGSVWLGMTVACAQCHDHKYDPISQRDYYALSAYFDSIDEDGRAGGNARPFLEYRSPHVGEGKKQAGAWLEREKRALAQARERALRAWPAWFAARARELPRGHRSYVEPEFLRLNARVASAPSRARLVAGDDGVVRVHGPNDRHEDYVLRVRPRAARVTAMRLAVYPVATERGPRLSLGEDGHVLPTGLRVGVAERGASELRALRVAQARADHQFAERGERYGPVAALLDDDPRSGWWSRGRAPSESRHAVFRFEEPVVLAPDEVLVVEIRHRSLAGHANLRAFRITFTDELGPARSALGSTPREVLARAGSPDELRAADRDALREEFLAGRAELAPLRARVAAAQRQFDNYARLAAKPVRVMVLEERAEPRATHVLERGVWDKKGARVQAAVPARFASFAPPPRDAARPSRAQLAAWLFDEAQPLTARVFVNRLWQKFFGAGLVRTPGDFGAQGQRPEQRALLDWLSVEFRASGWDIKRLVRAIVTSATYRQSSRLSPELRRRDPENRLLARQARFRLPSWMIRDAALRVSGLLDTRVFGPPVFPPQPDGLWRDATMGRLRYRESVGPDRYRRSLYAFWRRLSAPAMLFDAPARRVCRLRELRTNTPLQALTLMNDRGYREAAYALAERVTAGAASDAARARLLMRVVLQRAPDADEAAILARQLAATRAQYARDARAARELVRDSLPAGRSAPEGDAIVERAAWTMLAATILNLDECVVRP